MSKIPAGTRYRGQQLELLETEVKNHFFLPAITTKTGSGQGPTNMVTGKLVCFGNFFVSQLSPTNFAERSDIPSKDGMISGPSCWLSRNRHSTPEFEARKRSSTGSSQY